MKRIFLIGAGRSVSSLVNYLLSYSEQHDWQIVVADANFDLAKQRTQGHPRAKAVEFDVFDKDQLFNQVERSDLVISMLPANLHHFVAKACVHFEKSLLTASYVSEEIKSFHEEAQEKGILILMETGLDPGLDHMSAMKEIDAIKSQGGELLSFKSFTGGLVAPESDDNPWNYKITWNPRNVVLAGQGVVKFIRNNKYKYIPYSSLFSRLEKVNVKGYGEFEGYANRNSLRYMSLYGLEEIPTIFRGTLRRPGFCSAWNVFALLGMTDDTYYMENTEGMTYREYINSFLVYHQTDTVEKKLADFLGISVNDVVMDKIAWLGLFSDRKIGLKKATPAQILQKILEEKWQLSVHDKDMIVMQHQFEYRLKGDKKKLITSLVLKGDNAESTSMAKTVGLPLGIAAKLVLTDKVPLTGVQVPVRKELYEPILHELKEFGIDFFEQ